MKYLLAFLLIPTSLFSSNLEDGIHDAHIFHHNEFGIVLEINGHLFEVNELKHCENCPCNLINFQD